MAGIGSSASVVSSGAELTAIVTGSAAASTTAAVTGSFAVGYAVGRGVSNAAGEEQYWRGPQARISNEEAARQEEASNPFSWPENWTNEWLNLMEDVFLSGDPFPAHSDPRQNNYYWTWSPKI